MPQRSLRPTKEKKIRRGQAEILFLPRVLQAQFNPGRLAPAPVRSAEDVLYPAERLLSNDLVSIAGQELFVQAWLIPARQEGYYHIKLQVSAHHRLPRTLRATLTWAGQVYQAELARGQALFEDISPPDFSLYARAAPSRDFSIRFEIIDPPDA